MGETKDSASRLQQLKYCPREFIILTTCRTGVVMHSMPQHGNSCVREVTYEVPSDGVVISLVSAAGGC